MKLTCKRQAKRPSLVGLVSLPPGTEKDQEVELNCCSPVLGSRIQMEPRSGFLKTLDNKVVTLDMYEFVIHID